LQIRLAVPLDYKITFSSHNEGDGQVGIAFLIKEKEKMHLTLEGYFLRIMIIQIHFYVSDLNILFSNLKLTILDANILYNVTN
jgi:hypothetical protein